MEQLMSFFENFDIENLGNNLPSLESLMAKLPGWMVLLVLIGPLLMLCFGLCYLFFAPKEANHSIGYRFSYAMSRVEVWQFTQQLAGITYGALGLILLLIMGLISLSFGSMAPPDLVWLTFKCLLWQVGLAGLATLAINISIVVLFDVQGEPRELGQKVLAALDNYTKKRTPRYASTAKTPRRKTPSNSQKD